VVCALDRRIAAAAEGTLRVSRRGAGTTADAAARAKGAVRRDAPRVAAWLLARAREAGRATLALLRFAGRSARSLARVLGDVAVLAAVGAAALWRRAEAALAESRTAPPEPAPEPPDVEAPEWRRDADVPLARERRDVRAARRARR
jgi:hypothetical protein